MTENNILMDIHGKVSAIDERTELHTRQIGVIFSMMNDKGCACGKRNAEAIKWLWTVVCIGCTAIMGIIGYFHLSE